MQRLIVQRIFLSTFLLVGLFCSPSLVIGQAQGVGYGYDSLDRILIIAYPDKVIHFTYDDAGNRTGMTIEVLVAAPVITSLTPGSALAGSSGLAVRIHGTNFTSASIVQWNGQNRTTTSIDATELRIDLAASDIATAGTASVVVVNSIPSVVASNAVTFSINAAAASQTITFDPLSNKVFGDPDFAVAATASSGLPVSFSAGAADQCTITGSLVHLTAVGACTITASQPGDANYDAAPSVARTFNIAAPVYNISGKAIYGGTPAGGTTKYVPGVITTASGASSGSVQTDSSGVYSLGSLSAGNNTVTPTRTGDVNSINSTDALRIQQYMVGTVSFTAAQKAAADASGNGTVNSTDALRIQQWIVGTPASNVIGQWRFLPPSKNYASLGQNLSNEDYTGILMGEVSGNWVAPAGLTELTVTSEEESGLIEPSLATRPIPIDWMTARSTLSENSALLAPVTVTLPANASAGTGSTVLIPIDVSQLPAASDPNQVFTYNFNLQFDSTVLSTPTAVTANSISAAAGGSLLTGSPQSNVYSVSYTNTNGITGQGTLIYIRFNVIGTYPHPQTDLSFVGTTTSPAPFEFNEGDPQATTNTGHFTVAPPTAGEVSLSGRIVTANGNGIQNARVVVSGNSTASPIYVITGPFGYFHVAGLDAGDTYVVTINSKSYTFEPASRIITLNDSVSDLIFVANP